MPIYTNDTGAVQTAYVGYKAYVLTANLRLYWPSSYQDSADVVAAYMEVSPSAAGLSITLPDAREVSVGQNFIISNIGAHSFNLLTLTGITTWTLGVGEAYYFILKDNTTADGIWHDLTFGAGTSSATASSLDGYGLNARALLPGNESLLNTQIRIKNINASPYNVTIEDYTSMLVWTGGTGSIILPKVVANPAAMDECPPFYYISVNNSGTGQINVTPQPGVGIQGSLSLPVAIGQTLTVVAVGTPITVNGIASSWFTLGFGQQNTTGVTVLNKDVSGAGTVDLTVAETSNLIQRYFGTLSGARLITFPANAGEWFIYNNTTGAFALQIQLAGALGTIYTVAQNSRAIFYSDGASLYNIPTDIGSGTVTLVSAASNTGLDVVVTDPSTTPHIDIELPLGTAANQLLAIDTVTPGIGPQTLKWVTASSVNSVNSVALTSDNLTIAPTGAQTGVVSIAVDLPNTNAYNVNQPLTLTQISPIHAGWGDTVYLRDATVPTIPGNLVDGEAFVDTGQFGFRSGNAPYTGNVVVANRGGTAPNCGTTAMVAGTFTITNASVLANSLVMLTVFGAPTTGREVTVSARSVGSFTVTSSDVTDTRNVFWLVVNSSNI